MGCVMTYLQCIKPDVDRKDEGSIMCNRRIPCFVTIAFIFGFLSGSAVMADVTTPQALSIGETYRINPDGFTGDEATTEPKIDSNDGLNGDNIYYQRYNVARAHSDYWYTSAYQDTGEPSPSDAQWVDYKPPLSILGPGIYSIEAQYRYTESRASYDVPYVIHHATGTSVVYQNQGVGTDYNYYTIDLGIHDLGSDGWVRVDDPGSGSITFNRMRFTYMGPSSGDPVALIEAAPASGDIPLMVSFDGSDSYDNEGTIVSYEWDFTDDGIYDESSATATTSHVYATKGVCQCRLRVTDDESNTGETTVTIEAAVTFEDYSIAHWAMDDNAASVTVVDSVGAHDGVFSDSSGSPSTDQHHSTNFQEGTGSLDFDGVDDYVTVPRDSVLETGHSITNEFAVSAWIKSDYANAPAGYNTVAGTGDGGWLIANAPGSNKLFFACWLLNGSSGETAVVENSTVVFDGRWHHIVGVFDGSSVHMYVDGNHAQGSTIGGTIRNMFDAPVLLGENGSATGRHWDGLIDDVKIYNEAPGEEDVTHLYNPNRAWNPTPADDVFCIDESSVTLNWLAGDLAVTRDVYLGTDESLVTDRDASVYKGNIISTFLPVGTLLAGTEYFWAVDEINSSEPESPWLGEVWSFTTNAGIGSIVASPSGHYVTYNGDTLMLIGDSGTQCAAQNSNLDHCEWIDDCHSRGIRNIHVWSFIAVRQKQDSSVYEDRWGYVVPDVSPWARSTSGPLALDQKYQWNLQVFDEGLEGDMTHYWPRMRDMASYAKSKGILLGVTMFTGWAKPDQDPWEYHPFKAINGGHLTNAEDAVNIATPGTEVWQETYDEGWTNAKKTQWIWEQLSIKFINDLGSMGNVYFVYFDEHSYSEGNMGNHFMDFFRRRGMVWMDWNARRSAVDWVMSDSFNGDDRNNNAIGGFMGTPVRPYFNLEGLPNSGDGVREAIWTFSIGGGHYIFHGDENQETVRTGIMGYDPYVPDGDKGMYKRDWLGYASRFFNEYVNDLDLLTPWNSLVSFGAYCLGCPGEEYAVYSKGGYSNITVNLSSAFGKTLDCRFYDPRDGIFETTFQRVGGSSAEPFTKPSSEDWVLHIVGQLPVIAEISPNPDTSSFSGVEYTKQLQLVQGDTPVTWSVVQGPVGIEVDSSGYVDNWIPGGCDVGNSVTIEIRTQNVYGSDTEAWQVEPERYYMTDNVANLSDLMLMADEWLSGNGAMATDLDCNGSVDFGDFAELSEVWLEE